MKNLLKTVVIKLQESLQKVTTGNIISNRNRNRNIIWLNRPFNKNFVTNAAKPFLNLVDKHFLRLVKLHEIFYRNTGKVSYSCNENMANIIQIRSLKITNKNTENEGQGHCWVREEFPLDGMCQKMTSLTNIFPLYTLM